MVWQAISGSCLVFISYATMALFIEMAMYLEALLSDMKQGFDALDRLSKTKNSDELMREQSHDILCLHEKIIR